MGDTIGNIINALMLYGLPILGLLSILGLSLRVFKEKNGKLLARILSRIFFLVVSIVAVLEMANFLQNDLMFAMVASMTTVLLADVAVNITDIFSAKYTKIIELDKLTKALAKIEDKYYCILESQQSAVYVIDGTGQIEYVNTAFCKLSGYSRKELYSMNILELIDNRDIDLVRKNIHERITGIKPVAYYNAHVSSKEGRVFKVHIVSSRTENGHPTITGNVLEVK
jgi:PAS domain S-box-containing protein